MDRSGSNVRPLRIPNPKKEVTQRTNSLPGICYSDYIRSGGSCDFDPRQLLPQWRRFPDLGSAPDDQCLQHHGRVLFRDISHESPPSYTESRSSCVGSINDFVTNDENIFVQDAVLTLGGQMVASYIRTKFAKQLAMAKRSVSTTISALYAAMLVVLCLAFTSTEIITNKVRLNYFESMGFYSYVYGISIIFMIYLLGYVYSSKHDTILNRWKGMKSFKKNQDDIDVNEFMHKMGLMTGLDVREIPCPFKPRSRSASLDHRRFSIRTRQGSEVYVKLMTSQNDQSHGSLFLRIGAIAFGLGTIIYTGLEFLTFFEVPTTCQYWGILEGIDPVLYMVFVFMQMYFVFMNSKLNVNRGKVFARFGMMHLVAANACIVIKTLVKESAKEIYLTRYPELHKDGRTYRAMTSNLSEQEAQDCQRNVIIGETIEDTSVYLFPFIVEYSIIGCSVLFRMWQNIGNHPDYVVIGEESEECCKVSSDQKQRTTLDWSNSSLGLFIGLFALATLITSLIVYFALVNHPDYRMVAILVNNLSDTGINVLMIFAILVGFFQIRRLDYVSEEGNLDLVMILTAFGILVYNTFTVIAGALSDIKVDGEPNELIVINGLVELIQANLQLMFIADLKCKRISLNRPNMKYGREIVTFLLISNLGLWITYNFEIQKVNSTPDQMNFYGVLSWVVIQRIALPLCVFFRFHSTVILAELWKNCYRVRNSNK